VVGYGERVININRELVEARIARMKAIAHATGLGAARDGAREQLTNEALRGLGVSAGVGVTP
jgi:hypothetical protein